MANVKLNIITATNMQGLIQLENKLKDIKQIAQSADSSMVGTYSAVEIQKTVNAVNTLQHALRAAYDTKLNTVNIEKFNQYLTKSKMSVQDLYINLSRMGAEGRKIFMDMTQQTLMMGRSVKQTNALVTEMQTTMKNTVKWGISSGLWNNMLSSVSQAWTYVKGLNSDLNDIRIVTGKSADQMERFAKTANKTAKELAVSTRDYTQGALLYYQQGDDEETVKTKTDITAKTSNVTGQDMATVSEQLTAVWNGYQVANQAASEGMQVYEEYVDKLAAVAATTASDLEEQATAMSKVASAAYSMGVDFDDLNAQISTIVSVTRQAPESVGTALKTIYARLGDLKVDGVDEFGVKLGEVSSQLQTMGVDVLDTNGEMRDMSDVMAEVAGKWNTWTSAQKEAAAVAMAGKRQYNNLIALFDNQDMYNKALSTSMEANGTLAEQQAIAVEDLDSKLQKLATSTEKIYDALFNEESVGGLIDAFTVVVDLIGSAVQGIGGLGVLIPAIGGKLLKSFGSDIGNAVAKKVENKRVRERELKNDDAKLQLAAQLGNSGQFLKEDEGQQNSLMAKEQKVVTDYYKDMSRFRKNMTDEEIQAYNVAMKYRAEVANIKLELQETVDTLQKQNKLTEEQYNIISKINKGEKITEEETKQLEILKEKVKQQRLLVEQAKAQVETEQLKPVNVGIEISRKQKTLTMEDLKNKSETAVSGIVTGAYGQNADADDIKRDINVINEVLIEARKNGLQAEQAISFVKETLEETSDIGYGDSIFNDLRTVYQDMEKDTKAFSENVGNVFDEQIGEKLKESLGDDAKDVIEELRKKVVELTKQGKTFEEAYTEAIEGIGDEATKVEKTLQDIDISNIDLDNADFELKGLLETQELKTAMEGLSSAAGGTMQLFAGFTGVMNAFKAATDPALTSSERLKAAFLGLVTSIPMIIAGIGQVISGYGVLSTALNTTTVKATLTTLATTAAEKAKNKFSQASTFLSNVLHLESQSLETNTDAHENNADSVQENGDTRDETSQEVIEDIADNNQDLVRDSADAADVVDDIVPAGVGTAGAAGTAGTGAGAAGAGVGAAGTAGAGAGAAGAAVSAGALAAVAAVAAAVIAVIAVVVISLEDYQKSLEEDAKALEELTAEQEEYSHELKAEKDSVDAIVDSYKSLQEQYESNSITLEELREKTVDICLEYNNQRLAIQALTADYEQLNNIMKQAQLEANTEYQASLEQEQSLRLDSLSARLKAESSGSMRDGDYLDLRSFLGSNQATDILKDYIDEDAFNGNKVTFDAFAEALATNYDEIVGRLSDAQGNGAENLLEVINTDNVQNLINAYKEDAAEQENLAKTIATQKIFAEKDIQNVGDYASAVQKVTEEIRQYYDTEKEAQQAASLLLSKEIGGAEGAQLASDYELLTKVAKKQNKEITEEFLEDISSQIQDFSNTEKNFLTLHINTLEADEELQAFLEKYGELIGYESNKHIIATIETRLTDANATEFTESELDSLFQEENMIFDDSTGKGTKMTFEQWSGYSQEDFESLDFNQQRQITANYYKELALNQKNAQLALEEAERLVEETGADVKSKQQNYDAAQEEEKDLKNRKDEAAKDAAGYRSVANSWWAQVGDLAIPGDATGELLDNAYDIEQTSKENYDRSKEATALAKQNLEASQASHNEALNYQAEIQKSVENSSESYKKMMEITAANHKAAQADLKSFGDEYKSLVSAMNDYNESGIMTVDTLTALLELSPEMLENLTLENGKLKLNQDAAEAMAQARINTAKAMLLEEYQSKLLAIANGELKDTDAQVAQYNELMAQSIAGVGDAANEATGKIIAMNAAELGIEFAEDQMSMVQKTTEEFQKMWAFYDEIEKSGLSGMSGDNYKAELKYLDDEFDRYWDLNNIIEKTSQAVDELADAQDKLTRGELQDNLKEQNKLLEEQVQNYKNLRVEQEQEAAELRGKLLNYGANFAADGSLTNYAELTAGALEYYNKAAEQRQRGEITDAQLEMAEKTYDAFKESLERYDELYYDEMVETAENTAEAQKQILENNLESFEVGIQIVIDKEQFEQDLNDFLEQANTDITKEFEDLSLKQKYIVFDVNSNQKSLDATLDGFAAVSQEVQKLAAGQKSSMFESLSQAQEKLKEYTTDAIEYATTIGDAYEEAWDNYLEGIDQADERLQKEMEGYERVNEQLEYQSQLIELIYGPEAYDLLDTLYNQQQKNTYSQIQSLKSQKDMWAELYAGAAEGSEDQAKYFALMNEAQASLNENVTAYIELLKNEYANTIDSILLKLENQITNDSTFEDMNEQWERMTERTDKYYDNLESIYHIQTLSNNVAQDIANMNDVKNQQKLQKVLDKQLVSLREKENLTQTDLDIAQKKLDIAKAEIALEEVRASKTSMRLTRGDDGNWFYQYIADAENVASKQQELIDLQYDLYQLNVDAYSETLETLTKLEEETLNKWKEIATSEILTQEEKEAKIAELLEYYTEEKNLLVGESELYKQGIAEATAGLALSLYHNDADNFEEMTDKEQELVLALHETNVDSFADIEEKVKENLDNIGIRAVDVATDNIPQMTSASAMLANEWSRDRDGVQAVILEALRATSGAMGNFQTKVDEVAGSVGEDFGESGITGAINNTTSAIQDAESAIDDLCSNTSQELLDLKTSVEGIASAWENVKEQIEAAASSFKEYYELKAEKEEEEETAPPPAGNTGNGNNSGWASTGSNSSTGNKNTPHYGIESTRGHYVMKKYAYEGADDFTVEAEGTRDDIAYKITQLTQSKGNETFSFYSYAPTNGGEFIKLYNDKEVRAGSFDTGGYTGEWGSTGRMAFLHEKELILNKEDTKNILAAVNGIRQFSSVESAITKGIASMIMNMAGMGVNANYNTNEAKGNQTEQVFNITAEFPNANDVSEIREAILSLPGLASQQVGLNLI